MQVKPRSVNVEAGPEPLTISLAASAVLVIDMQNDFGACGGMLDRAGRDVSVIRRLIPPIRRITAVARDARMPVIYLTMAHRPDLSDAGMPDSPHWLRHKRLSIGEAFAGPDGKTTRCLIDGTWGTEILPELGPKAGDIVVRKHRYSGFFKTELDASLRAHGIRTLIVTGCTTSVCVESTVRDAMNRDYVCLVLADAVGQPALPGIGSSAHVASLRIIEEAFGYVTSTDALAAAIHQSGGPTHRPQRDSDVYS